MRKVSRNHLRRAHRALRLGFMLVVVLLSQGGPSTAEAVSLNEILSRGGDAFYYNYDLLGTLSSTNEGHDINNGFPQSNSVVIGALESTQLVLADVNGGVFQHPFESAENHNLIQVLNDMSKVGIGEYEQRLLSLNVRVDGSGSGTYVGDLTRLEFFGVSNSTCASTGCGFEFDGKFRAEGPTDSNGNALIGSLPNMEFKGIFSANELQQGGNQLSPQGTTFTYSGIYNDDTPLDVHGKQDFGGSDGTHTLTLRLGEGGTPNFTPFLTVANVATAPEPSPVFLIGSGLLGLLAWRRKQVKAHSAQGRTV